jgi:hypothetical protein
MKLRWSIVDQDTFRKTGVCDGVWAADYLEGEDALDAAAKISDEASRLMAMPVLAELKQEDGSPILHASETTFGWLTLRKRF